MIELQQYVLQTKVHEGPDTSLYEGQRTADGLQIVGKLLKSPYPSPRDAARIRHEYSLLKDLIDIPGIPRPLGLERYGNSLVIITERVAGKPLNEVMKQRTLSVSTCLRIAHGLAEILEQVHSRRVTHKDIKPHNILFDEATGRVHLIDFGIAARLSYEVQKLINPQALEGSLAYMSPEQTGRMNRVIDHRTDFYSLGVTLYELLVGELPFNTQDPTEMIHCHVARTPVPPAQRIAALPALVSQLCMKLLAKAAEDRYQTARRLKLDLARCIEQLDKEGKVTDFVLGAHDRGSELRMPQKLYGREQELAQLQSAFERAGRGETLLLMVSGHSGVGKSALVHEVHKDIARRGGYFVAGKFDQFNRSTPYAPLAQAFRELVRQLLTESESAVAQWRQRFLAALGPSAKVLIDLIPELELLIGPQPEPPQLGPSESQNRFQLLFQEFLHVFDRLAQPIVLFLDDLQWADLASLKLLRVLLTAPQSGYLLVIGAYRDNEVDVAHPLMLTLEDLRKGNARTESIVLEPLSLPSVVALISDMAGAAPAYINPLAQVVYQKTLGNPFFLGQFLMALHTEGLLAFDEEVGTWVWSELDIRQKMETANVISVLVGKIARLPAVTQHILMLAACIGHQFDLQTLALISERTPAEAAAQLWGALLQENLVVPLDPEYRFVHDRDFSQDGSEALPFKVTYRFLHDRVQQAAYSLIPENERPALHLRIGRLLQSKFSSDSTDELLLFDTVNHLNIGLGLITDQEERWRLVELNLTAGQCARTSTAYAAAAGYYLTGISMLTESDWQRSQKTCFALYSGATECDCLNGRFDRLEPWIEILLKHVATEAERALVHKLRIQAYSARGEFAKALQVTLDALAELGISFPADKGQLAGLFMEEFQRNSAALGDRKIPDLLNAPLLTDTHEGTIADLLHSGLGPAYLLDPTLFSVFMLKLVNIALRCGTMLGCVHAYSAYGYMLSTLFGRVEEGYQYGQLSLALDDKFGKLGSSSLTSKLNVTVASYMALCKPARDALPYYERSCQTGLETGDFTYASYGYYLAAIDRFLIGDELSGLRKSIDKALLIMQRTREPISLVQLQLARQFAAALQGETRAIDSLDDATFNEAQFLAGLQRDGMFLPFYWHGTLKAQLCYLAGDYRGVVSAVQQALAMGSGQMGVLYTIEQSFYLALALLALKGSGKEVEGDAALLTTHQGLITNWAQRCPPNFKHKELLLSAEEARISGRHTEAEELYDQAIAAAKQQEFLHHVALGNELAARHYLQRARQTPARAYLVEAHYAYTCWGATAKAQALRNQHPKLLTSSLVDAEVVSRQITASATTSSRLLTGGLVDVGAVLRASQTLSSEIVLDKLLAQLMRITVTSAGAERGVLLLHQQQHLIVNASINVHPEDIQVGLQQPLEGNPELPATIVQYVARTGEPIVLSNAEQDIRYARDPYISSRRSRSVMCLPLNYQGRTTGVLYLENNLSQDAFTAERIELLRLLSTQAAIALENAMLYASVQSSSRELRQSNRELADANTRLQAMTDELRRSNQEISEARTRLETELTERVRAQQARAQLQEEIIQLQNARLAEMSTPLIPITQQIMVMPLIGTMDNSRASQMLETALQGVQDNRAEVVILDITGMKQVDTSIAATILQTAAAVRLLGAQVILTGIRAEIAQTLVGLGVDLSNVVTRGTLQGGIAYALSRTGQSGIIRGEGTRTGSGSPRK